MLLKCHLFVAWWKPRVLKGYLSKVQVLRCSIVLEKFLTKVQATNYMYFLGNKLIMYGETHHHQINHFAINSLYQPRIKGKV